MSKAYDFLKECGSFFVLSINGDYPAGRPFGAVMEVGDYLYLSTNDMNSAHTFASIQLPLTKTYIHYSLVRRRCKCQGYSGRIGAC